MLRRATWDRFWWRPASAESLAACRIAFYAAVLLLYGSEDFTFVVPLADLLWRPIWFVAWISPDGPPATGWIVLLQWTWRLSLLAALLGFATRLATATAFVVGIYLLALPYCVSRVAHESAAMVIALGVMAFARPADTWSIDRARRGRAVPAPSAEYRWPVALVQVVLSLVFFSSGVSKLRRSGLDWITSDNLQLMLAPRAPSWADALIESTVVTQALAAATVAIEIFHPLALLSPVLALVFVPAGLGLLGGILVLMGIPFWPLVALHLFWIPWERLRRRVDTIVGRLV